MNFKVVKKAGIVALATVLAGCGSSSASAATASAGSGNEVLADEQVLNLVYTDLDILDVNDARNANEFQVLSQVQEGLFRTFNEDGVDVSEPADCTDYEVSDDNLTYTFHLREDAKWSDGEPVTAQNYIDSWLRLLNPDNAFPYAYLATTIAGAEDYYNGEGSADDVAITKVDDYTFTATLAAPDPAFISKVSMLPMYPIRKDLIDAAEASGGNWTNDYTLHVYNGPFVISDRVLQNSMTLTKNDQYWDADNVKLEQVNLQVVDESSTQAQLMESQQLDVIKLEDLEYVDEWQNYVDDGTFVHVSSDAPSCSYISFDMHDDANGGPSGLMQNAKIRKAITLAFDREEYNELFMNGLATPAYGLVPYGISVDGKVYRDEAGDILNNDENAALAADADALKELFQEGLDEVQPGTTPEDVTLTTITYSPTTLESNIYEWEKQQLEDKLGVTVDVETYPDVATWKEARDSYEYDFYTMGWYGDYDDPSNFLSLFTTDSAYAKFMGGYSNEEYDALIADADSSLDEEQRLNDFIEAENLLLDEGGVCPLYFESEQFYLQSYVKGVSITTFGPDIDFSRAYIVEH